jgi:23S rRNA-/tRNA-specific pseudouridylate synthase
LEAALIKLSSPATREYWEIPVLLEDERLLVVAKPAGLAVSPDRLAPDRPSLLPLLHQGIAGGKPWARERGITYLAPVHRLDPEASGVLVLARSKATLVHFLNLVASEKPFITYLALVAGAAANDQFEVDAPLARRPAPAGFVRVDPRRGKKSRTRFEVVERFSTGHCCGAAVFNRPPGRAHLRHAGFPWWAIRSTAVTPCCCHGSSPITAQGGSR